MNFYTCLPVRNIHPLLKGGHLTTMFAPIIPRKRITLEDKVSNGLITSIVDCAYAIERYNYWTYLGFKYDYTYRPHITLGKGNIIPQALELVNQWVFFEKEAINFKP